MNEKNIDDYRLYLNNDLLKQSDFPEYYASVHIGLYVKWLIINDGFAEEFINDYTTE